MHPVIRKANMKICYATNFLPSYHKLWGGAEQVCYRLANILIKNGHQLSILATKPLKKPEEDFDFFTIPVFESYLPQRMRHSLRQLKLIISPYDMISHISSHKTLKKINPDILHLHNVSSLSFALAWSAQRLRIPTVYSVYDYSAICPMGHLWLLKDYADYEGTPCSKFHGPHCVDCLATYRKLGRLQKFLLSSFLRFRKRWFDFFLNKIDGFVVLSPSNAEALEEYGIEKERIFIIPIPLSEEIDALPIEKNSILFVGVIQPRKGPHIVLEAMPQILTRIPDAKLYVIGEMIANKEYEEKMASLVDKSELQGHIFLLGKRPYNEVRDFIQKANVLVIPEQWETIPPNTLTEGLVFGKAIVASRIGGLLDFIVDGENGLLADTHDSIDFTNKIISILEDQDLSQRLSRRARETGLELFSEEKVYQKLLDLYQSLSKAVAKH